MGFVNDNCLFGKLTEEVIRMCPPYRCSAAGDIDSFFHLDNSDNFEDYTSELMGYSYCCYTEDAPQMVCAFSLSNSVLRTGTLDKKHRNAFNRIIPNPKRRSQYPATLLGRLCVFDGFRNMGVGSEVMDLIKTIALTLPTASRYLVVDAINNPKTTGFYEHNGFNFLFSSEEEEADSLGIRLPCKTRLMFFDLIILRP